MQLLAIKEHVKKIVIILLYNTVTWLWQFMKYSLVCWPITNQITVIQYLCQKRKNREIMSLAFLRTKRKKNMSKWDKSQQGKKEQSSNYC